MGQIEALANCAAVGCGIRLPIGRPVSPWKRAGRGWPGGQPQPGNALPWLELLTQRQPQPQLDSALEAGWLIANLK